MADDDEWAKVQLRVLLILLNNHPRSSIVVIGQAMQASKRHYKQEDIFNDPEMDRAIQAIEIMRQYGGIVGHYSNSVWTVRLEEAVARRLKGASPSGGGSLADEVAAALVADDAGSAVPAGSWAKWARAAGVSP